MGIACIPDCSSTFHHTEHVFPLTSNVNNYFIVWCKADATQYFLHRGHNWNQVSISSTQDVFPLTSTVKNNFIARCNADASYTVVTIENIDQLAFLPLNSSGKRNFDPKRCSVGTILTTNTFNIIGNSCCIMIKVLLWY